MTDTEGNIEDEGVLADTIPDEEVRPQAFQFDDLRDSGPEDLRLTEQEYSVLYETTVNGTKQNEIAEETGQNKSTVSRVNARAEDKARKWLAWLRNATYKQVKAHICMTYSRRPSLRPNKIAKSTLDLWNAERDRGLEIVPFRDPAAEWHVPIMNQPFTRATRHCWNTACTSGVAIGPNNLVLPAARKHEAVRFLPATSGKNDDLCEGCDRAANRTKSFQTVSDRPERLIERVRVSSISLLAFPDQPSG